MVNPLRQGMRLSKSIEPCSLVIFGATGDLTQRKLAPALFSLEQQGLLPNGMEIVGFARREKPMFDSHRHILGVSA